jgi:hypothetical protein
MPVKRHRGARSGIPDSVRHNEARRGLTRMPRNFRGEPCSAGDLERGLPRLVWECVGLTRRGL